MDPPPQPPQHPLNENDMAQFAAAQQATINREDTGNIRMYGIRARIEDMMHEMSRDELLGAHMVLSVLSHRLCKMFFDDHIAFDRRALVKTIEELWEISCEINLHKFPDTPPPNGF
jgi:hypothetical protein